jgi:hypothetical protein
VVGEGCGVSYCGEVEIAGFALALVGFLLAAGVWFRSSRLARQAEAQRKTLESRLARVETRNKQAEAKAQAMTSRARELEKELAEAVARRDEKAMANAMWALELERSYRQWRDVIVPDPTSARPFEATTGQQLAFAVSQEVERLREEVGVSIRFEGTLAVDLEAETALGALRISEELLALAAKSADEIVVRVDQPEDGNAAVSVTVDCAGWETESDPVATDLMTTVQGMAARLDGSVRWNRNDDHHSVISVELPAATETIDVNSRTLRPERQTTP